MCSNASTFYQLLEECVDTIYSRAVVHASLHIPGPPPSHLTPAPAPASSSQVPGPCICIYLLLRRAHIPPAPAHPAPIQYMYITYLTYYRVSHNWVLTLVCLFSRLPVLVQTFILPFCNSPGDVDSKAHLTFHPMSKIDQVTEQNVRQTEFRYYFFGKYKVYLHYI